MPFKCWHDTLLQFARLCYHCFLFSIATAGIFSPATHATAMAPSTPAPQIKSSLVRRSPSRATRLNVCPDIPLAVVSSSNQLQPSSGRSSTPVMLPPCQPCGANTVAVDPDEEADKAFAVPVLDSSASVSDTSVSSCWCTELCRHPGWHAWRA